MGLKNLNPFSGIIQCLQDYMGRWKFCLGFEVDYVGIWRENGKERESSCIGINHGLGL